MSAIAEARKLEATALVQLFKLDATPVGGVELNFTTDTVAGQSQVVFGGVTFIHLPVRVTGMKVSSTGPLQTPTLTIANSGSLIQEFVNTWGNLAGCKLTRIRTYARFLDNGATPNSTAFFGPDVFTIDRKASDTPEEISWELSVGNDMQGVYVGRTIIRDTCMARYRYFNPSNGQFEYAQAQCPYSGTRYFNKNDVEVFSPSLDEPSRSRKCCTLRFGENGELPFHGFPGILRGV